MRNTNKGRKIERIHETYNIEHECCHCRKRGFGLLEYPKAENSEYDFTWIHPKCLLDVVDGK